MAGVLLKVYLARQIPPLPAVYQQQCNSYCFLFNNSNKNPQSWFT